MIDNIEAVLAEAGMTLADIVRINIFTTDMDLFRAHAGELERLREAGSQYASTLVGVTRLAFPEFPSRDRSHRRQVVVRATGGLGGCGASASSFSLVMVRSAARQRIARGLTGDPVPPGIWSGATTSWNS